MLAAVILIFWLFGLAPVLPFVAGTYLHFASSQSKPIKYGHDFSTSIFGYLYLLTYFVSIFASALTNTVDDRVLASLYNWLLLFFGIVIFRAVSKKGFEEILCSDRSRVGVSIILVASCLIGISLPFLTPTGSSTSFPSAAELIVNTSSLPPLLRDSMTLHIAAKDWGSTEDVARLSILAPYTNALAGTLILLMAQVAHPKRWARVLGLLLSISAIALTRSRVGLACGLFVIFLYYLPSLLTRKGIIGSLLLLSLLLAVAISIPHGISIFDPLLIQRDGSDSLRATLYIESITRTWQDHPFLGNAVKPRLLDFEMPLGSHSTYVGAFYKTGIIGFLFFFLFIFALFLRASRLYIRSISRMHYANRLLSATVIALIPFLALEDLDAPQILLTVFFINCGLVLYRSKT